MHQLFLCSFWLIFNSENCISMSCYLAYLHHAYHKDDAYTSFLDIVKNVDLLAISGDCRRLLILWNPRYWGKVECSVLRRPETNPNTCMKEPRNIHYMVLNDYFQWHLWQASYNSKKLRKLRTKITLLRSLWWL